MNFSYLIIDWYLQNKRDLPWRNTTNPYQIWLSEIILQQTRVVQGLPYFLKFINQYPTVFDLANASEEEVLKLWQGLGYYSRARNLHFTAQKIVNDYNGVFPNNFKELQNLKGIGEYTAAAIASFSYNEVVPVVDGNVFRVLSRFFNIETNIALPLAKNFFFELASSLISTETPALFNQAIMEFGAIQCVPQNPNCNNCILKVNCLAFQNKKVAQLPIKIKVIKNTHRYFNYLIFEDEKNKTVIIKREKKGIWYNLYEFPLIETKKSVDLDYIISKIDSFILKKNKIINISEQNKTEIIHKLTHQTLHIKFWKIKVESKISNGIAFKELIKLPFPIVIYNFIKNQC